MLPVVLVVGLLSFTTAFSQDEGNAPPTVTIVEWNVLRDGLAQSPPSGGAPPVFDRDRGDPLSNIAGQGITNEGAFLHFETDFVLVTVRITDADWTGEDADEGVFLRFTALPFPYRDYPPDPPPVVASGSAFFGVTEDEGFQPPEGQTSMDIVIRFQVPEFLGTNAARLQGEIDWDTRWLVIIEASNEQEPGEDVLVVADEVTFVALEDPDLGPPNPPPFADAGPDQLVALGTTVILDGGGTFDGFNVGFDPANPNAYEKDILAFDWEQLSGPEQVTIVRRDLTNEPEIAEVTVNAIGTYVFRLIVSDGVNPTPSTDTVEVTVVSSIPENNVPTAVIDGPTAPVVIGSNIVLNATGSSDPDGDPLTFRWRQTDELGGLLGTADLARDFLPLDGLDAPIVSWQAVQTGTFYLTLIVTDPSGLTATDRITIEVVPAGTAGEVVLRSDGDETGDSAIPDLGGLAPACGAGLAPLALLPLLFWPLRSRCRW